MSKRRGVAQFGSALALGARCRRFESCLPDAAKTSRRLESEPPTQGGFLLPKRGREQKGVKPKPTHGRGPRLVQTGRPGTPADHPVELRAQISPPSP